VRVTATKSGTMTVEVVSDNSQVAPALEISPSSPGRAGYPPGASLQVSPGDEVVANILLAGTTRTSAAFTLKTSLQPAVPTPPAPYPTPGSLTGLYTLRLGAGPECAAIPEIARNRTYSASIHATDADSYVVTLGDAVFLQGFICNGRSGLGCNRFRAWHDGDGVRFHDARQSVQKFVAASCARLRMLPIPGVQNGHRG
jgi:hypothetical protein